MVAKQIRRELSDMLLTDKVLQFAVLPEASLGADRYLSSLTTITDVHVSGDLQVPSYSYLKLLILLCCFSINYFKQLLFPFRFISFASFMLFTCVLLLSCHHCV